MTEQVTEDELLAEQDDAPLRWYLIVAFVVALVGGFAVMVYLTVTWGVNCSRIDDGLSNVAGDSMRGRLCQSGSGAAAVLMPAGWVLGLVLATVAMVRWRGGARGTVLLVLMFVTPTLLPMAAYAGLQRSSKACPDQELSAYREWVDAGSKGTAPHDCRTY